MLYKITLYLKPQNVKERQETKTKTLSDTERDQFLKLESGLKKSKHKIKTNREAVMRRDSDH